MKKLIIVESPAKIKTIKKFLGEEYAILSTVGHIKDLPQKNLGVAIDDNGHVAIDYQVLENKDKVIKDIISHAKKADSVFIAPDPDREGEIIAWHIFGEISEKISKKIDMHRVTFNEITKTAVLDALKHPRSIDEDLVAAQQARRVLDRWVGYQISPILWRKLARGLSAGRVQSVALKLICNREEEIRAFVPEEYWTIEATFLFDSYSIASQLVKIGSKKAELKNEEQVKEIVSQLSDLTWSVGEVKDTTRSRKAPAPFTTSTLQQSAYNQMGFSVQQTMQLAQQLYEGIPLSEGSPVALITYMRTDSTRISTSAASAARSYVESEYGKEYIPSKANSFVTSNDKGQDAHEAIRPIDITVTPGDIKPYVESKIYKLYELIWRRFVACQMSPALYSQRQINFVDKKEKYTFRASGSVITFDGFLKVYDDGEDEEEVKKLPPSLLKGQSVSKTAEKTIQHFTQAPFRYTQATLVKELEKQEIGRPSTYATILKTIQLRDYTQLDEKKRFQPTELGMKVTQLLENNFPHIMDVTFTAQMEKNLDKVARGESKRDVVLYDFYKDFSHMLSLFAEKKVEKIVEHTDIRCGGENCQEKLVVKLGKSGDFLACPKFPQCTYTSAYERDEKGVVSKVEKVRKILSEECPQCNKPLELKKSKYGEFISCSGYPACKYTKQQMTTQDCLECGKGKLVRRVWKKGAFWSCQCYPACNFSISGEIQEQKCPLCAYPFMKKNAKKDGTLFISCASRSCSYSESVDGENEE